MRRRRLDAAARRRRAHRGSRHARRSRRHRRAFPAGAAAAMRCTRRTAACSFHRCRDRAARGSRSDHARIASTPSRGWLKFLLPVVTHYLQASLEVEHAANELAERYEEINLLYTTARFSVERCRWKKPRRPSARESRRPSAPVALRCSCTRTSATHCRSVAALGVERAASAGDRARRSSAASVGERLSHADIR